MVTTSSILTKDHINTETQIRTRASWQSITHIITGYIEKGYLSLFFAISVRPPNNLKWIHENVTHNPSQFLMTVLSMSFTRVF